MNWTETTIIIAAMVLAVFLTTVILAARSTNQKQRMKVGREEDLRQLVRRYEQLAETTMDAQQRVATDLAELRTRTTAIEQILRTVE
jgi:hypothetical protein